MLTQGFSLFTFSFIHTFLIGLIDTQQHSSLLRDCKRSSHCCVTPAKQGALSFSLSSFLFFHLFFLFFFSFHFTPLLSPLCSFYIISVFHSSFMLYQSVSTFLLMGTNSLLLCCTWIERRAGVSVCV